MWHRPALTPGRFRPRRARGVQKSVSFASTRQMHALQSQAEHRKVRFPTDRARALSGRSLWCFGRCCSDVPRVVSGGRLATDAGPHLLLRLAAALQFAAHRQRARLPRPRRTRDRG